MISTLPIDCDDDAIVPPYIRRMKPINETFLAKDYSLTLIRKIFSKRFDSLQTHRLVSRDRAALCAA